MEATLIDRPAPLPSRLLFDYMIEKLMAAGIIPCRPSESFRNAVPDSPFLWMPGKLADIEFGKLMNSTEVNGMNGVNFLVRGYCADTVKIPDGPYFLTDIEDGSGRLNTTPSLSEARIVAEGRSPYTILEGIIHAVVFPEAFATHNMDLCGSRYKKENIPLLILRNDGLRLQSSITNSPHPRCGAPSCKDRRGAHGLGI